MQAILIRMAAVFLMILLGVVARRTRILDSDSTRCLALLVTRFFYPALIYASIVRSYVLRDLAARWYLPVGTFGIMAVGFGIGFLVQRLVAAEGTGVRRALHFQCAINNYVFLPMPLVIMLLGDEGVAALGFSTVGSELAVWTLGVVALTGAGVRVASLRHLFSVPMAAIVLAWVTLAGAAVTGLQIPAEGLVHEAADSFMLVLRMLGGGTVPLAMIAAGSRMAEIKPRHLRAISQVIVVVVRLVVVPGLCIALLSLLPLPAVSRQVLVIVAVMPSAIASVMLSDIYDADSEFAATSVLLTHVGALVTIPVWLAMCL